ncbi:MAG: NUDIX domain-containing protein [Chloroflexota bacterium]|nr:NUDIX domain-containing protein [Chloroflexota bacterium]
MIDALAFGERIVGVRYELRSAAYAVIRDSAGKVAVVRSGESYFLVGGGCHSSETPEQTLAREAVEECAQEIAIDRQIGAAIQYFEADGTHFEMQATFFEAHLTADHGGESEHELVWLSPDAGQGAMYHECHAWAITQCVAQPARRS